MNTKDLQNEILKEIKGLAKEISQVQSFSGLLMHQQKIQILYEKFSFLKQLSHSRFYQIADTLESEGVLVDEINTEVIEEPERIKETVVFEEPVKKNDKKEEVQENILKEEEYDPIIIDYFDSIALTKHLFNGDKGVMDEEIHKLNRTRNIAEARKWMEEMFVTYDWREKQEYVEVLSRLIIRRFEVNNLQNELTEKDIEDVVIPSENLKEEIDTETEEVKSIEILPEEISVGKEEFMPEEGIVSEELELMVSDFMGKAKISGEVSSVRLEISDSIDFIGQLFSGNKADMDNELVVLNSLRTPEENTGWIKEMYKKHRWQGKTEIVKRLVEIIAERFSKDQKGINDKEKAQGLTPIPVDIAEIKESESGVVFNPIRLSLNDSIAFISQLFGGDKSVMDDELKTFNSFLTLEESLDYLIQLEEKYKWEEKEEYINRLKELVTYRFES